MAIYNPNVAARCKPRLQLRWQPEFTHRMAPANGDAYAYWTWQPNVVDSPFAVPPTTSGAPGDPGGFNLIDSEYWALLNFVPGPDDVVRKARDGSEGRSCRDHDRRQGQ